MFRSDVIGIKVKNNHRSYAFLQITFIRNLFFFKSYVIKCPDMKNFYTTFSAGEINAWGILQGVTKTLKKNQACIFNYLKKSAT